MLANRSREVEVWVQAFRTSVSTFACIACIRAAACRTSSRADRSTPSYLSRPWPVATSPARCSPTGRARWKFGSRRSELRFPHSPASPVYAPRPAGLRAAPIGVLHRISHVLGLLQQALLDARQQVARGGSLGPGVPNCGFHIRLHRLYTRRGLPDFE